MKKKLEKISRLVLIAGPAGAGKTSTINAFADSGYYTVDNLPVALFPEFVRVASKNIAKFKNTAMLLDIESKESMAEFLETLKQVSPEPEDIVVVYLECKDEEILKRYSETRRPHPGFNAARDSSLVDTIKREKLRLQPLREIANKIIDTSETNIHDLRRIVREFADGLLTEKCNTVRVNFCSFGFKHGPPIDCDLIMDVRFLPNPHFVEGLREKTGLDKEVQDYLLAMPETQEFITKFADLLEFLIPKYIYEGKAYINIGIGCTGGRHRSITIAEYLANHISTEQVSLSVKHRDLGI